MSTTPPPGDEPVEEPVNDTAAADEHATHLPPGARPLPPRGFPPPPPPPGYAFAPVARPPRAPWINPERRWHVASTAIGAAVVALAVGFGIGVAAGDGRDRGDHRMERGYYMGPGGGMGVPGERHFPRNGQLPGYPGGPGNTQLPGNPGQPSAAPTSPSASSSGR
jgi:hypothetical protein